MRRATTKACVGLAAILGALPTATAQHPAAKTHPGGHAASPKAGHPGKSVGVHPGNSFINPHQQMEIQSERAMQEAAAQQAARLHQRQAQYQQHQMEDHRKAMGQFDAWRQANASSSGSPAGTQGLPSSPAALKKWADTQRHKKALRQTYDPTYDEYHQFLNAQKPAKAPAAQASTAAPAPVSGKKAAASPGQATPSTANGMMGMGLGPQAQATPSTASSMKGVGSQAQATAAGKKAAPSALKGVTIRQNVAPKAETRQQLAGDLAVIGHLRTAHARLREADATYEGQRVQAMRAYPPGPPPPRPL